MVKNQYRELMLSLTVAVILPMLLGLFGGLLVEGLRTALIFAFILLPAVCLFRILWA